MRSVRKTAIAIAGIAVFVLLGGARIPAQDVAVVNAKTVTVKLENPRVRVMEATLKPGDKEQMHSHPAYVIYVITGGTVRNHNADGTTAEATYTPGQTIYREPLTHWSENIGTTTIHMVLVELKAQ
jgi:quercetin dioxygenase-like cupin family protein